MARKNNELKFRFKTTGNIYDHKFKLNINMGDAIMSAMGLDLKNAFNMFQENGNFSSDNLKTIGKNIENQFKQMLLGTKNEN